MKTTIKHIIVYECLQAFTNKTHYYTHMRMDGWMHTVQRSQTIQTHTHIHIYTQASRMMDYRVYSSLFNIRHHISISVKNYYTSFTDTKHAVDI